MLGHRGCRLGITSPEIYDMQVRAIMEAACAVAEQGVKVEPEIMIPLTGTVGEMKLTCEHDRQVAEAVLAETGVPVQYTIGTMIEVPRAALIADKIAAGRRVLLVRHQRPHPDDVRLQPRRRRASSCPTTSRRGCCPHDPFAVLDQEGVGELIQIGIERGRRTRPDLKVGICGEHGGEPSSVEFCHRVGMTYVSCSPFMIPIARLSAAQAHIGRGRRRPKAHRARRTRAKERARGETVQGRGVVLECLKREGVDIIFGLPGGAVLPIYDALYDFEGLRHILVRQEAAAGHAAEGYARATGKVASAWSPRGRPPPTWSPRCRTR